MGFLHYNTSVEEQVGMVREVKLQTQAAPGSMNGNQVSLEQGMTAPGKIPQGCLIPLEFGKG